VTTILEKWLSATFKVAKDGGIDDALIGYAKNLDIKDYLSPLKDRKDVPVPVPSSPYAVTMTLYAGGTSEAPGTALLEVIKSAYGEGKSGESAMKSSLQAVINQNTKGADEIKFGIESNPINLETVLYFYL